MINPAYKMEFDWAEFLAGSSIAAVITEGIRYFKEKKNQQLDATIAINDIAVVTQIMRETLHETFWQRFLVFRAEDSAGAIVVGKQIFVTAIYEEYDKDTKLRPMSFKRWQADSEYYQMFSQMKTVGCVLLKTSEMPPCKLKDIYLSQGIKCAYVFHLATTDNLDKVFFCSLATTVVEEPTVEDLAITNNNIDTLRAIFEKYKKFH